MSSTDSVSPRHPVLSLLDDLDRGLKSVADVEPVFMGVADKREALVGLSQLVDRLSALRLRVVAVADDVAEADGHRNAAAWLSSRTRTDGGPNRRDLRLAEALDRRWEATGRALVQGRVNLAQAHVIVDALEALPGEEVDAETLTSCEARLIEEAAVFSPRPLAVLGRKILEVVAPVAFEQAEAKALDAEGKRAHAHTSLFTRRLGDGLSRITITVPDATADRLDTYLTAYTSPRRPQPCESGRDPAPVAAEKQVPYSRQLGHAFCSLLEHLDPHRLPAHGGDATTILVTLGLDQLRTELGAADLGVDGRLSASEVRRLACTATIIPAVLGKSSVPLDLGRSARLFSPHQRKAMAIRDKTCRTDGCTMPASFCEAHHHGRPWSKGGKTDLDDGRLLCPFHHHRAHDDRYLHTHTPNGDCRFHRRT